MAGKNTAVYGIYRSRQEAEAAVDRLIAARFRSEDISVLLPENSGTKDFAHEKNTKAPEGTTTGLVTGGVVGGTLGLLAGIGALAIPGLGPLIAAGPIMGALSGIGVGGAVGGFIGALVGMGIPEYEAKRYEGRIRAGGILLSVHCDDSDWVSRAKTVLEQTGADDIASAEEAAADFAKTDRPLPRDLERPPARDLDRPLAGDVDLDRPLARDIDLDRPPAREIDKPLPREIPITDAEPSVPRTRRFGGGQ